mgnify:CR=1 FL=1
MLIYFSATGNTKHLVEEIAYEDEEIINIEDTDIREISLKEGDRLGIISPTHAMGLPFIVKDYLEELKINFDKHPYTFYVGTCGGSTGYSSKRVEDILKKKGLDLDASFDVVMPETFVLFADVNDDLNIDADNELANITINEIWHLLEEKATGRHLAKSISRPMGAIIETIYGKFRSTKQFNVNDDCISCGICERDCPEEAIRIEEGKPIWVKPSCLFCLRCYHACPTNAINYGTRTIGHGQYLHPDYHKEIDEY